MANNGTQTEQQWNCAHCGKALYADKNSADYNWPPYNFKIKLRQCTVCKHDAAKRWRETHPEYGRQYRQKRKLQKQRPEITKAPDQLPQTGRQTALTSDSLDLRNKTIVYADKIKQLKDDLEVYQQAEKFATIQQEEIEAYEKGIDPRKVDEFYEYLFRVINEDYVYQKIHRAYYDNNIDEFWKGFRKREMALAYKRFVLNAFREYVHVLEAEIIIINAINRSNDKNNDRIWATPDPEDPDSQFKVRYIITKSTKDRDRQTSMHDRMKANIDKCEEKRDDIMAGLSGGSSQQAITPPISQGGE